MPKFSIKDMLMATLCLALGLSLISLGIKEYVLFFPFWFLGGFTIGSGILLPTYNPRLMVVGGAIGVMVQLVLLICLHGWWTKLVR